ncbi:MAG: hypothetical protein M1834_006363 [Cirrosporium novae-zelandiae]|nr:MAG: hypothetical protein M1834_006363 [Cirrosporium novae-zelandiae]
MAKPIKITSTSQFVNLVSSSNIVVADFTASWCGPCKAISPMYDQLSAQLSQPNKITFTKIDVDEQQELARSHGVTSMPTFMIFKKGRVISTITGADPKKLSDAVRKLAAEASSNDESSSGSFGEGRSGGTWIGAELPRTYRNVTDEVDVKGLNLLNTDSNFGGVRTLFDSSEPGKKGKGKANEAPNHDWVVSDTDEQLMLYVPFQSNLKIHSIHVTSIPDLEGEEPTMRPKTIKLYTNRPNIIGFEEADGIAPIQSISLESRDWDEKTNTARIELRFVKFQNVSSLVLFVVDGDSDEEKVRLDRIRIIGETGEKRDMGKLEKISDEA